MLRGHGSLNRGLFRPGRHGQFDRPSMIVDLDRNEYPPLSLDRSGRDRHDPQFVKAIGHPPRVEHQGFIRPSPGSSHAVDKQFELRHPPRRIAAGQLLALVGELGRGTNFDGPRKRRPGGQIARFHHGDIGPGATQRIANDEQLVGPRDRLIKGFGQRATRSVINLNARRGELLRDRKGLDHGAAGPGRSEAQQLAERSLARSFSHYAAIAGEVLAQRRARSCFPNAASRTPGCPSSALARRGGGSE